MTIIIDIIGFINLNYNNIIKHYIKKNLKKRKLYKYMQQYNTICVPTPN